ncbi:MAG: long-chain fatty acid--CoA ligase [Gemmatimonadetes bacterium]|nr:long-chain fatty acid--CoA ligase [Gemmatimonadota bacterium]
MQTIIDALRHHAECRPDRVALRTMAGDTVTWAALAVRADAVARALVASGVRPGDRVAVLAKNVLAWPLADLGTLRASAISVGVYPTSSPEQVAVVLADCAARVLIVDDDTQMEKVRAVRAQVPSLDLVVAWQATGDGATPWEAWLGGARGELPPPPRPDSDAALIYTSGSTGVPKGARISHACLVATAESLRGVLGFTPDDSSLAFLPFCHAAERMFGHATRVWIGIEAMLVEDIADVFAAASTYHPTIFGGLPRVFEKAYEAMCGAEARAANPDEARARIGEARLAHFGSRVRRVTSGGAALPVAVARYLDAHGVRVLGAYGQTEHLCVAMHRPDRYNFTTVGLPMPGTEWRIADDGEVLVRRSALTFSGYWQREDETREAFTPDGAWLRTGDLGAVDAEGFLSITGRKKELIALSSGKKVAPLPIEAALTDGPWIEYAVLFGEGRHFIAALFTLRGETLRAWAAAAGVRGSLAELQGHAAVRAAVQAQVDAVNATLSRPEQVKRWVLSPASFTADAGELTPTLKLRRADVTQRYGALVASLYE